MKRNVEYKWMGVIAAAVCLACGSHTGEANTDAVGDALRNLPEDLAQRADVLDRLTEDHAGDERLQAALRAFEADSTPGFQKRVDFEDGRFLIFVGQEDGTVSLFEGGPDGSRPMTQDRGLETANAVQLWEAFVHDAPVPDLLASTLVEAETGELDELERSPARESAVVSGGLPYEPAEPSVTQLSNDLAKVQQAWTGNGDQFQDAGGCESRPYPFMPKFANEVEHSPMCLPSSTGSLEAALHSIEMRIRVASTKGSFFLTPRRNGSALTTITVSQGSWLNTRNISPITSRKWCSRKVLGFCVQTTVRFEQNPSLWGVSVTGAANDGYHIGAIWFDTSDDRVDTQPW